MPYVKRTTRAGKTLEIEKYYTSRYNKRGGSRAAHAKPTEEQQKKINTRQAERRLRLLMNANFGYGDYHVVLDYIRHRGEPERTREQMRRDADIFLRELRKLYRAAGLELKYIHVMETGQKGARHHHLVLNHADPKFIQAAWKKAYKENNRVKIFPLDESGNYRKLAAYFIKYTDSHPKGSAGALQGKRWNCSKNLVRPVPEYEIINKSWFRHEIKAPKGYYIDKETLRSGINDDEHGGYEWLHYILVQLE
ncbi:MAG: hypothetical protein J6C19_05035 [Lachnospiraceae bacterium]|nr:hypothetical protein [Lachnospiraceae bacterium]